MTKVICKRQLTSVGTVAHAIKPYKYVAHAVTKPYKLITNSGHSLMMFYTFYPFETRRETLHVK